jgi:signal peptidase I
MDRETQRRAVCCELVSDVARAAGEVRVKVTGTSMLPAVWPGDVVTARHCDPADLKAGDIVLHYREGKLTVHRVKHISSDSLITRGDSVPSDDPAVSPAEILGKVVSILRRDRPISLEQSFGQNMVALALRRSNFCLRVMLAVRVRLRRWTGLEVSPCP